MPVVRQPSKVWVSRVEGRGKGANWPTAGSRPCSRWRLPTSTPATRRQSSTVAARAGPLPTDSTSSWPASTSCRARSSACRRRWRYSVRRTLPRACRRRTSESGTARLRADQGAQRPQVAEVAQVPGPRADELAGLLAPAGDQGDQGLDEGDDHGLGDDPQQVQPRVALEHGPQVVAGLEAGPLRVGAGRARSPPSLCRTRAAGATTTRAPATWARQHRSTSAP